MEHGGGRGQDRAGSKGTHTDRAGRTRRSHVTRRRLRILRVAERAPTPDEAGEAPVPRRCGPRSQLGPDRGGGRQHEDRTKDSSPRGREDAARRRGCSQHARGRALVLWGGR
eukprot:scaffold1594_cov401-Prasinococcus_capsulatus_cf.AAC.41